MLHAHSPDLTDLFLEQALQQMELFKPHYIYSLCGHPQLCVNLVEIKDCSIFDADGIVAGIIPMQVV